ncbi:MAG TPA: hypothetical protein DCG19_09840, partial [Cryomorphaceae bacterium]|nr:hypothetical protein [Cryomorphaceae bacterium]
TSTVDGIWLTVSDSSSSDELFIGFDHQATLGFDARLDARKLLNKNDIPNLYTSGNGEAFSITRVAPNTQTSFPLKLDNVADGRQLSLTLNTDQLLSYNTVVLEDKMLSVLHDLKASDYSFIQNEAYGPNRFVLHFSSPSIGVEEVASAQHWYAYATEDGIEVRLGELKNASIKVYDLSGRIIHYLEHQEGVARIPTNQTRQLYVVKVTSSFASGTQKIIR